MTPEKVARLLPGVFHRALVEASPLDAAVHVMAHLDESVRAGMQEFPQALSPWRAAAELVPMLESWVGLDPGTAVDEARARELTVQAAQLWRMRGTEPGIERLLHLATGLGGFAVRRGPEPFTLVVAAPWRARAQDGRVRRIVELMKPAAVRFLGVEYAEPEEEDDDS